MSLGRFAPLTFFFNEFFTRFILCNPLGVSSCRSFFCPLLFSYFCVLGAPPPICSPFSRLLPTLSNPGIYIFSPYPRLLDSLVFFSLYAHFEVQSQEILIVNPLNKGIGYSPVCLFPSPFCLYDVFDVNLHPPRRRRPRLSFPFLEYYISRILNSP